MKVRSLSNIEKYSPEPSTLIKELLTQPALLFNSHRLAILLDLYYAGVVEFMQLKHDLIMTDGALATHLKVLISEGFVEQRKEQVGIRTKTMFVITKKGLDSMNGLLEVMCGIRGLVYEQV